MWSCTSQHKTEKDIKSTEDHNEIIFSEDQAKQAQLEIITVVPNNFHQIIKTSGQILSAQGDEVTVSATFNGIVSFNKSALNEGVPVSAGESLLSISSKNIVDGDPTIKAKLAYDIAEKEYQRAESLIKDKLVSQKEYNQAKLNYEQTKITYQAAGKTTSKGVSITTPISGFIKSKLVVEGQYVDIGQPLMTVTQNRKLQLRADVSQRHYKDLDYIFSANFKTSYSDTTYQLSDLNGRLISFGKSSNNQEYYLPINFEFDNIGQIVPGSYVEVYLLGQEKANTITIPISSLVEEQGLYFVYIQVDKDGYKKQEVILGKSDGKDVEILSGVKNGDRVVSKGAYHVKLASMSSNITDAHSH